MSASRQHLMGEQESSKVRFGFVQFRQLLCFLFADFLNQVVASSAGPLYPPQAKARGLNSATLGIVTSVLQSALIVSILLFGTQIERFELKRIYVSCIFIVGLGTILSGFKTVVGSATFFLVWSVLTVLWVAFGVGGEVCALFMFPGLLFPGYISPVLGFIQTNFAVSTTVGPLLGTLLDSTYGYTFTYVLFGLLQLVSGVLVAITIPNVTAPESVRLGTKKLLKAYWALLKLPSVLVSVYACVVAGAIQPGISTILQPILQQKYGLTEVGTGWMFFLMAVPQFASPLWGFLIDRVNRPQVIVLAGAVGTVIGCIILGPFPGIPSSFPLLTVGLLVFGFSQGLLAVACICNLHLELIRHGGSENILNRSFLSIAYGISSSVGAAIGPLVSGLLYNSFGFPEAMLLPITLSIILAILVVCQITYPGIKSSSNSTLVRPAEERDLLLPEN